MDAWHGDTESTGDLPLAGPGCNSGLTSLVAGCPRQFGDGRVDTHLLPGAENSCTGPAAVQVLRHPIELWLEFHFSAGAGERQSQQVSGAGA